MAVTNCRFAPLNRIAVASILLLFANYPQAAEPAPRAIAPITANANASAPTAAPGWSSGASAVRREELLGCLLAPSAEVEVGSPVVGILSKVNVDRGDRVRKGQTLAQLLDEVERAAANAAAQRFENRADVAAAKSAYEFAQRKAVRAEELFQKNFISSQARDQATSEAHIAAMRYAQAQEQRVVAREDMAVARAQLGLRSIASPINGVVVDRFLSPGERVEDRAIVKLAQIDPLRVEVVAPAARFHSIKQGATAVVVPDLAGLGEKSARVTMVDAVIDAASNTFRVRLELPNPGGAIPSGLRCKVVFGG